MNLQYVFIVIYPSKNMEVVNFVGGNNSTPKENRTPACH